MKLLIEIMLFIALLLFGLFLVIVGGKELIDKQVDMAIEKRLNAK